MSRFLQLHLLTAYGAANLNRDDTGRPKTLTYGGAERLRISSQSLKRAFRTSDIFARAFPSFLGERSKEFGNELVKLLINRGLTPEESSKRVKKLIEISKIGKADTPRKDKKGNAIPGDTPIAQLVHLSHEERDAVLAMADRLAASELGEKESIDLLVKKPRAADIAMFGRMLADNPGFDVEAAVQVAHAFTTHRVTVEDDYYTAVDEGKPADEDADRGAGFIGVQHYGAGTFYLYICIDADLLRDNLSGDDALAADAAEALIRAAATISPGGKQNSFASRAKASYALLEIGADTPRSLAAAFQRPVGGTPDEPDFLDASVARLTGLRDGFKRAYGENFVAHEMRVGDPDSLTLDDLIAAARAAIRG